MLSIKKGHYPTKKLGKENARYLTKYKETTNTKMFYTLVPRQHKGERYRFSMKRSASTGQPRQEAGRLLSTSYSKMNSRWSKDFNVRVTIIPFIEENQE